VSVFELGIGMLLRTRVLGVCGLRGCLLDVEIFPQIDARALSKEKITTTQCGLANQELLTICGGGILTIFLQTLVNRPEYVASLCLGNKVVSIA